jgi:hypothetical protein
MNARQDNTLNDLFSVTDETFLGPANSELVARLTAAPLKSLFLLSRHAASPSLQCEAEKIMNARLREAPSRPPTDGAKKKGSATAQAKTSPAKPEQLLVGMRGSHADQSQNELPPILAKVKHFLKYCDGGKWVLTTDSGIGVAVFSSEADLDQWWKKLAGRRGRTLTGIEKVKLPDVDRQTHSSGSPAGTSPSDPLRPMSEKYDMPEYDLE